jgi:hypothetical protein
MDAIVSSYDLNRDTMIRLASGAKEAPMQVARWIAHMRSVRRGHERRRAPRNRRRPYPVFEDPQGRPLSPLERIDIQLWRGGM